MARDPTDTCLVKISPWIVIATLACVLLGCTNSDNNDDELFGPSSPPTPSPTNLLTSNPTTPPTPTPPSPSSPTPSAPGDVEMPMPPTPIPTEESLDISIPDTPAQNLAADPPPTLSGTRGYPSVGACRVDSATNVGTEPNDFQSVSVSSVDECHDKCDANPSCLAIEVANSGDHCEIWFTIPRFMSTSSAYKCILKKQWPLGNGGCRSDSPTNTGAAGIDFERVSVNNLESCHHACDVDSKCVAIEVDGSGNWCEKWFTKPQFTSSATGYECILKKHFEPVSVATIESQVGYTSLQAEAFCNGEGLQTLMTVSGAQYESFLHDSYRNSQLGGRYPLGAEASQKDACQVSVGASIALTSPRAFNAFTLRTSVPDGMEAILDIFIGGTSKGSLKVTSEYSWAYGGSANADPQRPGAIPIYRKPPAKTEVYVNDPHAGYAHHFFDDSRWCDWSSTPPRGCNTATFPSGSVIELRVSKIDFLPPETLNRVFGSSSPSFPYDTSSALRVVTIDMVDLYTVEEPIAKPAGAVDVVDLGADPTGETDASEIFKEELKKSGSILYIPPGRFKVVNLVIDRSDVTVMGAGMWHTELHIDVQGPISGNPRFAFNLQKWPITLRDFAIIGNTYTARGELTDSKGVKAYFWRDQKPDGITIEGLYIDNMRVGLYMQGKKDFGADGIVLRKNIIRDSTGDGIVLKHGLTNSIIEANSIRNAGDDAVVMNNNRHLENVTLQYNHVELALVANSIASYGFGNGIRIASNLVVDSVYTGGGIHVAQRYGAPPGQGTITVEGNRVDRCGSYHTRWNQLLGSIWIDFREHEGKVGQNISIRNNYVTNPRFSCIQTVNRPPANLEIVNNICDGLGSASFLGTPVQGFAFQFQSGLNSAAVELSNNVVLNSRAARKDFWLTDCASTNVDIGGSSCADTYTNGYSNRRRTSDLALVDSYLVQTEAGDSVLCPGVGSSSNCYLEGEEEPTEEPQCDMYEYTQVSTGACRGTSADDNDNSNYDVAKGFDGSQEDCQKLCSANNACMAVEFKVGATSHCELWKIKPQFGTGVTSYACFSKAPKPYEFTPVSSGACRGTSANDNDNSNYDRLTNFDGTQEDCQRLCSESCSCLAIEFKVGASNHCELWKVLPQFGTGVNSYVCLRKE